MVALVQPDCMRITVATSSSVLMSISSFLCTHLLKRRLIRTFREGVVPGGRRNVCCVSID